MLQKNVFGYNFTDSVSFVGYRLAKKMLVFTDDLSKQMPVSANFKEIQYF